MKKRMKQMGALLLTLAMMLSLSVSAFAAGTPGDLAGTPVTDATNEVTSEGGLPVDVTDVVLPTSSTGQFSMIFDSHGLIKETNAIRFNGTNNGGDVTDVDDARLFFKVYTETAVDEKTGTPPAPYALAVDFGTNPVIEAGAEVVKYLKAATIGKIYATGSTQGKDFKWMKVTDATHVDEVTDAEFGTGQAYEKIASLKGLDPATGYGLDAIAKLNKNNPNLYLKKAAAAFADVATVKAGTSVTNDDAAAKLVNAVEYTFVATYADGTGTDDNCYIYFDESGAATKFFKNLGNATTSPATAPAEVDTPAAAAASGLADFVDDADTTQNVEKAVLTVGTGTSAVTFYRQRENKSLLSLKATSAPVTVINKTNADIGVAMSAELTNIKGGDGKVDSSNNQTYVYAKDYDAATGKFYDDVATATTRNVIQGGNDGVPVFYFALTNGTDTEVMAYDSQNSKGTVSLGAMVAGKSEYFQKNWNTALNNSAGGYEYEIKPEHLDKREANFSSMSINFVGAIDSDNDAWNTFSTAPNIAVTWKVESITPPAAPTVTPPATVTTKSAVNFTISDNTENLVLVSVKQGETEVAADKMTITNDATTGGTTAVSFTKGTITGNEDVVLKFQDPNKTFRTKEVTVSFT